MTCLAILSILLAIQQSFALYDSDSSVKILTSGNFNKFIKRNPITVVEFFAPWCGHCKSLKPEYEKAASELKGIIPLAAVDANDDLNKDLAAKYEIKGFPTLFIFKNGKHTPFNYRDASGIVKGAKESLSSEYLVPLTKENSDEFFALSRKKVVVFDSNDKADDILKSISMSFHKEFRFGYVASKNKELVDKFNIKKFPSVVLLEGKDLKKTKDLGKYDAQKLREKLNEELGPDFSFEKLDIVHDHSCLVKHCVSPGKLCVFYVETSDEKESARRRSILQQAREDLVDESYFNFVVVNSQKHESYLKSIFGKKTTLKFPRVFMVSYRKQLYSPFKKPFEKNDLKHFFNGFIMGSPVSKIHRFRGSDLPKMTTATQKCRDADQNIKAKKDKKEKKESFVTALNDKNFDTIIKGSKMPVIVEFYAPWCGHCKKFAPEYEKLATKLEGTVLVAKVEATTETALATRFNVTGYPTIVIAEKTNGKIDFKKAFSLYKKERSFNGLFSEAKSMLSKLSTLATIKDGLKEFDSIAKSISDSKNDFVHVFFVEKKRVNSFIMDATTHYFSEKNVKFYRLPPTETAIKEKTGLKNEKMFILKAKKDGKINIFRYKNEKLSFNDLVLNLSDFFESKAKSIENDFELGELDLEKKGEKKEL